MTLFPEMIDASLRTSILGRAEQNGKIRLHTYQIRDFSADAKHHSVDDYTYGGGAGMLMQAQPVYDCYQYVRARIPEGGAPPRVIYVTPQGTPFRQEMARALSREEHLVFLCGHYEGIDERVLEEIVTDHISIGDYVLTGGELAAAVIIDAVARLLPGVLHNDTSAETESFDDGLLEYPQYSRPEIWREKRVPEILLSGDHARVDAWRKEQSILRTKERRPDLYAAYLARQNEDG